MQKLLLSLCGALLLAHAHDFSKCSTATLGIKEIALIPDTPVHGKPIAMAFGGEATEDISGGNATVHVLIGSSIVSSYDFDFCSQTGISCPVKAGQKFAGVVQFKLANDVVPGMKVNTRLTITDNTNTQRVCLDIYSGTDTLFKSLLDGTSEVIESMFSGIEGLIPDVFHKWIDIIVISIPVSTSQLQKLVHSRLKVDETSPGMSNLVWRTGNVTESRFGPIAPPDGSTVGGHIYVPATDIKTGKKGFYFLRVVIDSLAFKKVMRWYFDKMTFDIDAGNSQWNPTGTDVHFSLNTTSGLVNKLDYSFKGIKRVKDVQMRTHRDVWWGQSKKGVLLKSEIYNFTSSDIYSVPRSSVYNFLFNLDEYMGLKSSVSLGPNLCNAKFGCMFFKEFTMNVKRPKVA